MKEVNLDNPDFRTVYFADLVSDAFGMSKSEARRKLNEGAIKIDGEKWQHLTGCEADINGRVLQFGKRKFVRCRISS
jgi:tyrosyl-tRNA synthetase